MRSGRETIGPISWPEKWDPKEGWVLRDGLAMRSDPRGWETFASALWHRGLRRPGELAEALGGPKSAVLSRTLEGVDAELLTYWRTTNRRPTTNTHGGIAGWLKTHQNCSLRQRCDELGIPDSIKRGRALEEIDAELVAYWNQTGQRPNARSHHRVDAWLRLRQSSVCLRCDELNIPGGRVFRTLKDVDAELLDYWKQTGRRPTVLSHQKLNGWLGERDSSVPKRCDELGIPGGYARSRTDQDVDQELRAYWTRTGRRPTNKTHGGLASWLKTRGGSLSDRCDSLGLGEPTHKPRAKCSVCANPATVASSHCARRGTSRPYCEDHTRHVGTRIYNRTMEDVRNRVLTYFEKHGRRPPTRAFSKDAAWLCSHGSTLGKLSDGLGLPSSLNRSRTLDGVKTEVLMYFEEHGRRPAASTPGWTATQSWLVLRGLSLAKLGDELGLPPLLERGRTLSDVRVSIQSYFESHGRRPSKTEPVWRPVDDWLHHNHHLQLRTLCDEMGLPIRRNYTRTVEEVRTKIREYFDKWGVRPSQETSKEWDSLNGWLSRRGLSIPKLCDQMGLAKPIGMRWPWSRPAEVSP